MNIETAPSKQQLLTLLRAMLDQPARVNRKDYADSRTWQADCRKVALHQSDGMKLINELEALERITAAQIMAAARGTGTVEFHQRNGKWAIEYNADQNFPTEFRAAVARTCADVLWQDARSHLPKPDGEARPAGADFTLPTWGGQYCGPKLRSLMRERWGSAMQRRWWNP